LIISNDESHIIEINKTKLNLELGDKILEQFSEDLIILSKKPPQLRFEIDNPKQEKLDPINKKLAKNKSIFSKTKEKKLNYKENIVDDFSNFLNKKILKLKMTNKEFLTNTPKCDLCDKTGITLPELKKLNSTSQTDAVVLDYILNKCSTCKVFIHRSCSIPNTNDKSELINLKDLDHYNFDCVKCKLEKDKKTATICSLCNKGDKDLKDPHFFQNTEENEFVHRFCLMWKNTYDILILFK